MTDDLDHEQRETVRKIASQPKQPKLEPVTKPKNITMAQAKKAVRKFRATPRGKVVMATYQKAIASRPMRDGYEAGQQELLARIEREVTSLDTEMETVRQHALDEIAAIETATEAKLQQLNELKRDRLAVGTSIRSALIAIAEEKSQPAAPTGGLFRHHTYHNDFIEAPERPVLGHMPDIYAADHANYVREEQERMQNAAAAERQS